jgi:hypothetical protein
MIQQSWHHFPPVQNETGSDQEHGGKRMVLLLLRTTRRKLDALPNGAAGNPGSPDG